MVRARLAGILRRLPRLPPLALAPPLDLVVIVHGRGQLEVELVPVEVREEVVDLGVLAPLPELEVREEHRECHHREGEVQRRVDPPPRRHDRVAVGRGGGVVSGVAAAVGSGARVIGRPGAARGIVERRRAVRVDGCLLRCAHLLIGILELAIVVLLYSHSNETDARIRDSDTWRTSIRDSQHSTRHEPINSYYIIQHTYTLRYLRYHHIYYYVLHLTSEIDTLHQPSSSSSAPGPSRQSLLSLARTPAQKEEKRHLV